MILREHLIILSEVCYSIITVTAGQALKQSANSLIINCNHRVLLSASLAEDFWDLVDVDAFGACGQLIGHALGAVKLGGLVYLTSTDGLSAGGMPLKQQQTEPRQISAAAFLTTDYTPDCGGIQHSKCRVLQADLLHGISEVAMQRQLQKEW